MKEIHFKLSGVSILALFTLIGRITGRGNSVFVIRVQPGAGRDEGAPVTSLTSARREEGSLGENPGRADNRLKAVAKVTTKAEMRRPKPERRPQSEIP